MSKLLNNPVVETASGMLGDIVVFRKIRGQMQLANRPPRRRSGKPSADQAAVQRKFLAAAKYAKKQFAEAESKALYSTGITERKHSAYLVALHDYMHAPVVESIDARGYRGTVGDVIVVNAFDDFMVTKVRILITDAAGAIIEQGEAGPDAMHTSLWEYKTTVANLSLTGTKIQATAYDRPGNTGEAEVVL